MASRIWSEVYGLPGGYNTRVRVAGGKTDEGNGKTGVTVIQTTEVPLSLDPEGIAELAGRKPMLDITFKTVLRDADGEKIENTDVKQDSKGEQAQTRVRNLLRITAEQPAQNEDESERDESPVNANGSARVTA